MHLLRQIHRLKPGRKCAHQVACQRRGTAAASCRHLLRGFLIAVTAENRRDPILLDPLEQLGSTLLAQNLPDESAQRVNVFAQGRVLGWEVNVAAAHAPDARSVHPGFQILAAEPKSARCGFTTQNRWPVGASMTHHVRTCAMRLAPSCSRRRTSASMSSDSMSRCTRLACVTFCTSMCSSCGPVPSRR